MLLLVFALIVALSNAVELGLQGQQQPPPVFCSLPPKSGLQTFFSCPTSIDGYHIVCETVPFYLADAACANFGWRLAIVDPTLIPGIDSLIAGCTVAPYLWVEGYNGYVEDPCMIYQPPGAINAGLSQCESLTLAAVLCQDIPTFTETTTVFNTTTTTYGVTTETIATCDPAHCKKQPPPPPPCQHCKKELMLKSNMQLPCPLVCPLEIGNLHLVETSTSASGAAAVCSIFGWTLADLTTGTYGAAFEMMTVCEPPSGLVWINSYNGINSTCIALLLETAILSEPFVSFVANPALCITPGFVLCQDSSAPPAVTGSGVWIGSATFTTETSSTTVITTVPSSTRTATSYAATCRIHLK
jgi:hypothetical protein